MRASYIIRRLLLMIPTLFMVTIIIFVSIRLVPGDIIDVMMNEQGEEASLGITRAEIEHKLGLDAPIYIQYWRWFERILHGDLGESLWTKRKVLQEIINRVPVYVSRRSGKRRAPGTIYGRNNTRD